jgi:tellurite resistance protein TehA-like permease
VPHPGQVTTFLEPQAAAGAAGAAAPSAAAPSTAAPSQRFAAFTPNWFASVMGTGIVATAGATLPFHVPGLRAAATVVWLLAASLLVAVTVGTVLHWHRHPQVARRHHLDPVMAHFYGAPPMALLTVGAGALLVGRDLIGVDAATAVDWVLWSLGTALGLVTAAGVVVVQITRHDVGEDAAFGGWLMSVVPPMVSASTGALLVPSLPAGQARLTMLVACYAMFGLTLFASVLITAALWQRLVRFGVGPAVMVPTLWIVLGPLGQSTTAASSLGKVSAEALPAYSTVLQGVSVAYGLPTIGFALLWSAIAATLTLRARRSSTGLPFALTWWSFTFPVGTCVTGLSGLAVHTGSVALEAAAGLAYLALVAAWATVAGRTTLAIRRGQLLAAHPPVAA